MSESTLASSTTEFSRHALTKEQMEIPQGSDLTKINTHSNPNISPIPIYRNFLSRSNANYGPLTTTFTPPDDCTSVTFWDVWLSGSKWNTTVVFTNAWQVWPSNKTDEWTSCYPASFAQTKASWYSPGICPRSWSAYLLPSKTENGTIKSMSESSAACCPSGFGYNYETAEGPGECYSALPSYTIGISTDRYVETTTVKPIFAGSVWALPVEIRWQHTDSIKPNIPERTDYSDIPADFGKTSTGKIIGIAIGVPLFIIILLLVSFCILFRRRKQKMRQEKDKESSDSKADGWEKLELEDTRVKRWELEARQIAELPLSPGAGELAGGLIPKSPVELEGSLLTEKISTSQESSTTCRQGAKSTGDKDTQISELTSNSNPSTEVDGRNTSRPQLHIITKCTNRLATQNQDHDERNTKPRGR